MAKNKLKKILRQEAILGKIRRGYYDPVKDSELNLNYIAQYCKMSPADIDLLKQNYQAARSRISAKAKGNG